MIKENWQNFNREIAKIMAHSWHDEEYRQKFIDNPRECLEEAGISISNDTEIAIDPYSSSWRIEPARDGRGVVCIIGLPEKPATLEQEQIQVISEQGDISNNMILAFCSCLAGTACF